MPQAHREADQTEKAYQKQDAVFLGRKRTLAKKSKKGLRYVRNVGLGFKTPKLALEGSYVDKKCPFTGNVSIRGRILKGMVISTKMTRTVVIRRDYLNWCGKYRIVAASLLFISADDDVEASRRWRQWHRRNASGALS